MRLDSRANRCTGTGYFDQGVPDNSIDEGWCYSIRIADYHWHMQL